MPDGHLDSVTSWTAECRLKYDRDGFVILRRVFDPRQVAEVDTEACRLLDSERERMDPLNLRCRFQPHVETGEQVFETFDPVIDLSPNCFRLATSPDLLTVLELIYGEPACLFKDKLIFKPPGAKGYDLHQDWISWPGFPRSFLTVLIPLERADMTNGCTVCYRGYHRDGSLTPRDGSYHSLSPAQFDAARAVPLELDPGDVAIFGGFTPHYSDPNRSLRWRRQLYLSYNSLSDGGDRREAHYREFHDWMRQRYASAGRENVRFW